MSKFFAAFFVFFISQSRPLIAERYIFRLETVTSTTQIITDDWAEEKLYATKLAQALKDATAPLEVLEKAVRDAKDRSDLLEANKADKKDIVQAKITLNKATADWNAAKEKADSLRGSLKQLAKAVDIKKQDLFAAIVGNVVLSTADVEEIKTLVGTNKAKKVQKGELTLVPVNGSGGTVRPGYFPLTFTGEGLKYDDRCWRDYTQAVQIVVLGPPAARKGLTLSAQLEDRSPIGLQPALDDFGKSLGSVDQQLCWYSKFMEEDERVLFFGSFGERWRLTYSAKVILSGQGLAPEHVIGLHPLTFYLPPAMAIYDEDAIRYMRMGMKHLKAEEEKPFDEAQVGDFETQDEVLARIAQEEEGKAVEKEAPGSFWKFFVRAEHSKPRWADEVLAAIENKKSVEEHVVRLHLPSGKYFGSIDDRGNLNPILTEEKRLMVVVVQPWKQPKVAVNLTLTARTQDSPYRLLQLSGATQSAGSSSLGSDGGALTSHNRFAVVELPIKLDPGTFSYSLQPTVEGQPFGSNVTYQVFNRAVYSYALCYSVGYDGSSFNGDKRGNTGLWGIVWFPGGRDFVDYGSSWNWKRYVNPTAYFDIQGNPVSLVERFGIGNSILLDKAFSIGVGAMFGRDDTKTYRYTDNNSGVGLYVGLNLQQEIVTSLLGAISRTVLKPNPAQ